MEDGTVFSTNGSGITNHYTKQTNKTQNRDTSYHAKINSKQFTDINVKLKTIKLVGENFCNLGLGKDFSDVTTKAQTLKEKWINWLSSKLFLLFKGIIKKMEETSHRLGENNYQSFF